MASQSLKTVFYLRGDKFERIRERPSLGFDLFPSTTLEVYVPRLDSSVLRLESAADSEGNWHVDFIPCYTLQYFCFLAKIDRTNIVSQDRAYQNGGGFALLLATPKEGGQDTDEFTVFGICPFEERPSLQWSRFFVYYKDVSLVFSESKDAQTIVEKNGQFSYVFVAIPWKLAEPLTPFVTKEIGVNFWAAQAIQAEIPVQFHMLMQSEKLIAEQSLRDYALYALEDPRTAPDEYEITCRLESKHLPLGDSGRILGAVNSPDTDNLSTLLLIDDIQVANTETAASKGISRFIIDFGTKQLSAGQHLLRLEIHNKNPLFSKEMGISIYDPKKFSEIEETICKLKEQQPPTMDAAESISTLEYLLQTSIDELGRLKPYSSFDAIQKTIDRIQNDMSKLKANQTLFTRGNPIRMGFRSTQDQTLQPYSIYIPNSYRSDSGGLVILLHGSASNDTKVLTKPPVSEWSEKTGFIVIAPFARGESHFYLPKEASTEIVELTEKMMKMFKIPKERVVLAGFSMGGFGVINTYFFKPDLYRNLMVISGGFKPYANEPDWSTDAALQKLATTNLIIFHGDTDLNVPYSEQKPVHERLKQLNPNVEIVIAKGVGHQEAPEWKDKIVEYLTKIVA